jgi:hypothetical protein
MDIWASPSAGQSENNSPHAQSLATVAKQPATGLRCHLRCRVNTRGAAAVAPTESGPKGSKIHRDGAVLIPHGAERGAQGVA